MINFLSLSKVKTGNLFWGHMQSAHTTEQGSRQSLHVLPKFLCKVQ